MVTDEFLLFSYEFQLRQGWRNFNSKLLQNTSQYFLYLISAPGEKYLGELKVCRSDSRSRGTFISLFWRGGLFSVVFWGRAFATTSPPQNDCHSKHHIEDSCQRLLESLSYFSFEYGSVLLLWRRAVTFLQCYLPVCNISSRSVNFPACLQSVFLHPPWLPPYVHTLPCFHLLTISLARPNHTFIHLWKDVR